MAPSAILNARETSPTPWSARTNGGTKTALLHRKISHTPHRAVRASGNYIHLQNGWSVFDASCGAAVSSLGHGNSKVHKAIMAQLETGISYSCSLGFDTEIAESFAQFLVDSTGGVMKKSVFYGSGSEAIEAGLKIAVQYQVKEKALPQPHRNLFIARDRSYHGATLGALAMSGHKTRKEIYETILTKNVSHIPPCYPYRGRKKDETESEYVQRLKRDLIDKFEELGPENVAGFIAEPVVGAALGCVPAVTGYLRAMKEVCERFGALFILDEVMCGMGRCGDTLHAWQKEGVAPDIQLVGKGLAGGFQQISAILIGEKVVDAFEHGSANGAFNHGHTFQNFPVACAAGLAVQKIIQEQGLLQNVSEKGARLMERLQERLGNHCKVGDIRGEGLFLGIEFVQDKNTKYPFHHDNLVAWKIYEKGLDPNYGVHVYPGAGTVDGTHGDHIILAPAFNITNEDVETIVDRTCRLIEGFFADFKPSKLYSPS